MFRGLEGVRLNFLINNAGIWKGTPLGTSSPELIDEVIDTNLKGPFCVAQCALPLLVEGRRSSICLPLRGGSESQEAAVFMEPPRPASIHSRETGPWNLRRRKFLSNAVAPGYVTTDMTTDHLSDEAKNKRAIARHPLGRLGTPEDVADVVAFLCSHAARFITGQTINVSGGFVI